MKIYSWNVNGLRAISKKGFFQFIISENPDILCIQETKLQDESLSDELKYIDGYYSYFSFAEKKGYSGVAIYTNKKPISIKHGIGIDKFDKEGRILITEFDEFVLFNIYFPNGQKDDERLQYKLEFYNALFSYINKLKAHGKKIVICGDYNIAHKEIDLKNAKANENVSGFLPVERKLIDKFIEEGYIDTFRYMNKDKIKYSWWSYRFKARERNAGWRIDYFFITENLITSLENADILNDIVGSDHCPVSIILQL